MQKGALDFAGGTVVHINAAVAGLVGAIMIGKRVGYGRESMAPHSLTMTMIGASLLWVGWFGFNAGSALEAGDVAALAFVNTLLATAAATVSWVFGEWITKGKPSMLGGASGAVAGLVAITPACGFVGPMGAWSSACVAGVVCLWGVNGLKRMIGADDSLDVFGVHGVGGILGALLTGVFAAPQLGGQGIFDYITNKMSADPYSIGQPGAGAGGGDRHHHPVVGRRLLHRLQAGRHRDRPARAGRRRNAKAWTSPATANRLTIPDPAAVSPKAPGRSGRFFISDGIIGL